jgi:hypothetical protein
MNTAISTTQPTNVVTITEHEAQQVERANATGTLAFIQRFV